MRRRRYLTTPLERAPIRRRNDDGLWHRGPIEFPADHADPDGSQFLLADLDGRPETYQRYARDYFEKEIELDDIRHIYEQRPLTPELLDRLNSEEPNVELESDLAEIGYPS
ncbi:MAG: hypothetical protein HOV80_11530 [Polyangiaceae bacterium]|nr:hypothetical protein [Polyangiaceae bacterium]